MGHSIRWAVSFFPWEISTLVGEFNGDGLRTSRRARGRNDGGTGLRGWNAPGIRGYELAWVRSLIFTQVQPSRPANSTAMGFKISRFLSISR